MPPVVAVCPAHGTVPSPVTLVSVQGAELRGNRMTCPVPGCTQQARLVEGHFNFDNAGIAEIISAPDWSVAALAEVERRLATLRNVLENQSISDAVADQWVDRTVADLRARGRDYDRLADAVAARIKGKPRNRALSTLLIMLSIVTALVTIREGAQLAIDAVEWVGELVEETDSAKVDPADGGIERE